MQIWSKEEAQKVIAKRLKYAKQFRRSWECHWDKADELLMFPSLLSSDRRYGVDPETFGFGDEGQEDVLKLGVNYAFRNFRFIHAQLSSNPPVIAAQPTGPDPRKRMRADAADRLARWLLRAEYLQDTTDQCSAKTLAYGTGWIKTVWDPHKGDLVDYDPKTGEFQMEGKLEVSTPSTRDVWIDPDARKWQDVRYVFERYQMPIEEAEVLWPEFKEILQQSLVNEQERVIGVGASESPTQLVEIYEFWETGLSTNGMQGRHAFHLEDGTILGECNVSPFRFSPFKNSEDEADMPPRASLPYHIFTDIDVIDEVYGKSFLDYIYPIQEILTKLDATTLMNIKAHGATKLLVSKDTKLEDEAYSDDAFSIMQYTGTQPSHLAGPHQMPSIDSLREVLRVGGDDLAGINDSMLGIMKRETPGFALQYATNQGNLIRRRLFNKYVFLVESMFWGCLKIIRKHWTLPKMIKVLDEENIVNTVKFKGSDIEGGFDLKVEYGTTLSLDPITRRGEIMNMLPLFQQAGVDPQTLLSMLKLNELENLWDMSTLPEKRQREIFAIMTETGKYIAPREIQIHDKMLEYAYKYTATAEFNSLPEETKRLLERHIKEREQVMAKGLQQSDLGPQKPGPAGEAIPMEDPAAAMQALGGGAIPESPIPMGG